MLWSEGENLQNWEDTHRQFEQLLGQWQTRTAATPEAAAEVQRTTIFDAASLSVKSLLQSNTGHDPRSCVRALSALAAFPSGAPVPPQHAYVVWRALGPAKDGSYGGFLLQLKHLGSRGLAFKRQGNHYSLHDIMADFLRKSRDEDGTRPYALDWHRIWVASGEAAEGLAQGEARRGAQGRVLGHSSHIARTSACMHAHRRALSTCAAHAR